MFSPLGPVIFERISLSLRARDVQGQMRVLVDGEEVLSTVELFYRDEFTGLALVNRGGLYEWGPIRAFKAPKATSP